MTVGACKRCGADSRPSTNAICPKSESGHHEYEAVPVVSNTTEIHHHTIFGGGHTSDTSKVWSGMDGWRCPVHHKNEMEGYCSACTYAKHKGGINFRWRQDNPGAHTQSIMVDVPGQFLTTSNASAWDNQVGGQHYKKGIQPFEYAMANELNSLEFSVVKYLRKKGGKAKRLEDLLKAKHCLEMLIEWEMKDGEI